MGNQNGKKSTYHCTPIFFSTSKTDPKKQNLWLILRFEIFEPVLIDEWVDENDAGVGQTALCPKCGIDSVIGQNVAAILRKNFLLIEFPLFLSLILDILVKKRSVWSQKSYLTTDRDNKVKMDKELFNLVYAIGKGIPSERLSSIKSLLENGEIQVALDIVVSNLDDLNLSIGLNEKTKLKNACESNGCSDDTLELLDSISSNTNQKRRLQILSVKYPNNENDLHIALRYRLGFHDFYGCNWDAFWDAITGLVSMPEIFRLKDWDILARKLPEDAKIFLECLLRAKLEYPNSSACIELYSESGNKIDPVKEYKRLSRQEI